MAVQPQAGIAMAIASLPNKCLEMMAGSGESVLSAMARADGPDCVDGVLSKASQGLGH